MMMHLVPSLITISVLAALAVSGQKSAERCDPSVCRLPDCYCGGSTIPGGYAEADIPQFVLLTFDDAVNDLNKAFFEDLFKDRTNPNGCPIKVKTL
eukprot:TCALIF_10399-PA protein Name:"Protein of unknown function" AED:0.48 eAED:0.48 QI:0/0/0/0.5/1/1/2/0/95